MIRVEKLIDHPNRRGSIESLLLPSIVPLTG
jgi:hypothetical protein